jgi:hypothetical protein
MLKKSIFTILSVIAFVTFYAQTAVSFEAGLNLGAASIQSDYGERGDIQSGVTGNVGVTIGGVAYMNFFKDATYWGEKWQWLPAHIKLRGEVAYTKVALEHFIDGNTPDIEKLKAMHGSSSLLSFGLAGEYHFNDLINNVAGFGKKVNPFIGLGFMVNMSSPDLESDLGDYEADPSILPTKFQNNAIYLEKTTTPSLLFNVGTRINAGGKGELVLDSRWSYFVSNTIDGLDPQDDSDKFNDWMSQFSVGYVYRF